METVGILFDIKKFALHDGPGIRTTLFFKGCPLDCWWCHNPESKQSGTEMIEKIRRRKSLNLSYCETREHIGREVTVGEVMAEIQKDTIFYDDSGGGVTFSGGEPLMQVEFLCALLRECRKKSLHTAIDTSGYAPLEALQEAARLADLFLYDLKLMDPEEHRYYTGVSNELILGNLTYLLENASPLIIRFPVVPGITDGEKNIRGIINFLLPYLKCRRIDLLAYNKLGVEKYRRLGIKNRGEKIKVPGSEHIEGIRRMFLDHGFTVSIGG